MIFKCQGHDKGIYVNKGTTCVYTKYIKIIFQLSCKRWHAEIIYSLNIMCLLIAIRYCYVFVGMTFHIRSNTLYFAVFQTETCSLHMPMGVSLIPINCVNSSPVFVQMLTRVAIREALRIAQVVS